MKRRELERHLRAHNCRAVGEGANHTKWRAPNGSAFTVPRHREIATGTVTAICRQAAIPRPPSR